MRAATPATPAAPAPAASYQQCEVVAGDEEDQEHQLDVEMELGSGWRRERERTPTTPTTTAHLLLLVRALALYSTLATLVILALTLALFVTPPHSSPSSASPSSSTPPPSSSPSLAAFDRELLQRDPSRSRPLLRTSTPPAQPTTAAQQAVAQALSPTPPLLPRQSAVPWISQHVYDTLNSLPGAQFLLFTDVHLEPHFSSSDWDMRLSLCRHQVHRTTCSSADWESTSVGGVGAAASAAGAPSPAGAAAAGAQSPASASGTSASSAPPHQLPWPWSDPYPLGRYNCDSAHRLVDAMLEWLALASQSALTAAASTAAASSTFASSSSTSTTTATTATTTGPPSPLRFVLLPGDLVAHYVTCPLTSFLTFDRVLQIARTHFPAPLPIIHSIGNTDMFFVPPASHDQPPSPLPSPPPPARPRALATWRRSLAHDLIRACPSPYATLLTSYLRHAIFTLDDVDAIHTFCHGGFYVRELPSDGLRIVSLNTLLLNPTNVRTWQLQRADASASASASEGGGSDGSSSGATGNDNDDNDDARLSTFFDVFGERVAGSTARYGFPPDFLTFNGESTIVVCADRVDDPYGQLAWLEQQLEAAAAAHQKVYVVGHFPPGNKAPESPSGSDPPYGEPSWCPKYLRAVARIVDTHRHALKGLFFGDYSQDLVRFMPRPEHLRTNASTNAFGAEQSSSSSSSSPSSPSRTTSLPPHQDPDHAASLSINSADEQHSRANRTRHGHNGDDDDDDGDGDGGRGSRSNDNDDDDDDDDNDDDHRGESIRFTYNHALWIHGGITPRKHNNPVARIYAFNPHDATLLDYVSLVLNLHQANQDVRTANSYMLQVEYTFRRTFGVPSLTTTAIAALFNRFRADADVYASYARHVNGDRYGQTDYVSMLCDMFILNEKDNIECRRTGLLPVLDAK